MSGVPVPRSQAAAHVLLDADRRVLDANDAVMPLYSVTKTFLAATVVSMGVDLDARLDRWFDASLVPRAADISLAQVLTHTAGLRDYGALPEYAAAVTSGGAPWSDAEFAERTLAPGLLFEPGSGWAYSNPGYWLIGRIIERESDSELAEALARQVCAPLELSSVRLADGVFAEALPRYPSGWVWHGLLLANMLDVVRLLASPLLAPLTSRSVPVAVQHALWRAPHQGLGVMIEPGERIGHTGSGPGFSAAAFHFPRTGVSGAVVVQNPAPDAPDAALPRLLQAVAEATRGARHSGPARNRQQPR